MGIITDNIEEFAASLPRCGPLIGLDYGERMIGLAICDQKQTVAFPLCHQDLLSPQNKKTQLMFTIDELIAHKAVGIVIGISCAQEKALQQKIRFFAAEISKILPSMAVYFQEEYYTSQIAIDPMLTNPAKINSRSFENAASAACILNRTLDKLIRHYSQSSL